MKRTSLLVALAIVGMLFVPVASVTAQETETEENGEIAPGERLSGVVGVQAAEFEGEIERNAFRIGLEQADDNATRASHIAAKLNESGTRLTELDERKAELQEQRENGNITEGQYRARMARLAAEAETVRRQLNQSNATAAELPEQTLRENGVNTTAIRTLRMNASELSGPEVAEIARSIAGDRSGMVERGSRGDRNATDDRPGAPGVDRNDSAPDERPDDRTEGSERAGPTDEQQDGGEKASVDKTTSDGQSDDSDTDSADGDDGGGTDRGAEAASSGSNAGRAGNR